MTKKLEEELNLPPIEDLMPKLDEKEEVLDEEEVKNQIAIFSNEMSVAERADAALPMVEGLDQTDREMDDYATRAINQFEELCNLGNNVEDRHVAPIFDSASKMLQAALQAKQAKMDKKLKMIELQMRQRKLDQEEKRLEAYIKKHEIDNEDEEDNISEGKIIGDRTELLGEILSKMKDNDK